MSTLRIQRLPHAEGLALPAYQTPGSAGLDLRAAISTPVELLPGRRALIPTGLCLAIPEGYEGQVRPRSGLAAKHGVTVLNSPGTIDADYRGEVKVILINCGLEAYTLERGDRVAQLVLAPVAQLELAVVSALDATERGSGGFGHTGTS